MLMFNNAGGFMQMDVNWIQLQGIAISVLGALLTLIIGWIIAKLIASGVKNVIERSKFIKDAIVNVLGSKSTSFNPAVWISQAVYYVLMLFVIVATFDRLNLVIITAPLNNVLNKVMGFIPNLAGAGLLLITAFILATIAKKVVLALFKRTGIDQKLEAKMDAQGEKIHLGETISEVLYWSIFIIFLPGILDFLNLVSVLGPIQNMINIVFSYLPKIGAALVVAVVGWFVARLVKNIVTNLLKSLKIDEFGKKSGITVDENSKSFSEIIGTVVYAFIIIPVAIASLNTLELESISTPATSMLSKIFDFIPVIASAFGIVAIAYFVGKLVGDLVTSVLSKAGFNRVLSLIGLKNTKLDLNLVVGNLVQITIVLFASLEAASVLGFDRVSSLTEQFILLAGNVIVGVVIIGFGAYIANFVSELVEKSGMKNAQMLSTITKVAILFLATSMGLSQMGLASEIIQYTFIFFVGAIAVAFAIAFGLGGREYATKKLQELDQHFKK